MGVGPFGSRRVEYIEVPVSNNPNPKNFKVLDVYKNSDDNACALKVKYPDCTNREGIKILVYGRPATEVLEQNELDPHFGDNAENIYPVARFQPNDEGWEWAIDFVDRNWGY